MKWILRAGGQALLIVGTVVMTTATGAVAAVPGGAGLAEGYRAAMVQAGGGTPGHHRRHHTRHHRASKTRTASTTQGAVPMNKSTGNRPSANRQNPNRNRRAAG